MILKWRRFSLRAQVFCEGVSRRFKRPARACRSVAGPRLPCWRAMYMRVRTVNGRESRGSGQWSEPHGGGDGEASLSHCRPAASRAQPRVPWKAYAVPALPPQSEAGSRDPTFLSNPSFSLVQYAQNRQKKERTMSSQAPAKRCLPVLFSCQQCLVQAGRGSR